VGFLLGDPRVDPAAGNDAALLAAAEGGHEAVAALLVADPRVDPVVLDQPRFAALRASPPVVGGLAARP
jgi:hypothetical protein